MCNICDTNDGPGARACPHVPSHPPSPPVGRSVQESNQPHPPRNITTYVRTHIQQAHTHHVRATVESRRWTYNTSIHNVHTYTHTHVHAHTTRLSPSESSSHHHHQSEHHNGRDVKEGWMVCAVVVCCIFVYTTRSILPHTPHTYVVLYARLYFVPTVGKKTSPRHTHITHSSPPLRV